MKAEESELLKEFTPEQISQLNKIIEKHKGKPGGLIPVLEEAQVVLEYLPVSVQKKIAKELNLPLSRVYGVVTFYSFFTMTPRGKHTVRVCLGTACYVRGGKAIAETLQREFGIAEGETTADRMFTLESVRCLGACGLGPVVVVDDDVHGRVKPSKVREILNQYK
ncbi:MAG TPA: NADH-quinone oxidoreductase subunit NuoE [Smithellaceae bacterium]|mgnify:CR=1 FL=1|jgi:NADH:ubiquinone oxidoreductase subunit E|nr:MAG: NADP-reducing hydrogenase subunit HndA [Deltaproteobacteria bacterium ADurb.BinA014]HNQ17986.1 NADH-quinone oxidoreductase subunit NuoE [Smithellaceae bacterium]HNT90650.1 NADH-quinone oxidoreductase subunit NuoE [Smithellaceae bacterium]HNV63804.1 NADH-quinone oxidoreductase subunit NuoE [Smithellaceae bacterium]HNZ30661.1 NADH-quinone oxidoreductase subunit NuoE [Smithellaceae bacterium]